MYLIQDTQNMICNQKLIGFLKNIRYTYHASKDALKHRYIGISISKGEKQQHRTTACVLFILSMKYGYVRVASISPKLEVANVEYNCKQIMQEIEKANDMEIEVALFPELCITGYTCADLFFQETLQKKAIEGLLTIAKSTKNKDMLIILGLPILHNGRLFNCAALIFSQQILAIVPKSFIPNYQEFYERRWFSPFEDDACNESFEKDNAEEDFSKNASRSCKKTIYISSDFPCVPFGKDILICDKTHPEVKLAVELCEDLWMPFSPSIQHAQNGAILIANLSASNEIIGKAQYRQNLVAMQSAKLIAGYVYSNAGQGESSTDLIFSGHNLIAENGKILAETALFSGDMAIADIDTKHLLYQRQITTTFFQHQNSFSSYLCIQVPFVNEKTPSSLYCNIEKTPFVPQDEKQRNERCALILELQAQGLAKRLRHTKCKNVVIGISGGLDSTLALLVCKKAFDLCSLSPFGIKAVTMPCFGTTQRTLRNACLLATSLGCDLKKISIKKAVLRHFFDIGQDEHLQDVTYENAQARERTQVLMDLANKEGGLVIGTGDLSELALGFATYNGDQMSMYGVNSSIPKTLVRYLVEYFCSGEYSCDPKKKMLKAALRDILDTPVSPELLPPKQQNITQKTEDLIGPYILNDFFLFHFLRYASSPKKIFFLASLAFNGVFQKSFILEWEKLFFKRFFQNQFKRSCMPDGAKVGTVNLCPRGDWRMPSDACCTLWLDELEQMKI